MFIPPSSISDIPQEWVLRNYFDVKDNAPRIRFKSIFKPEERTPSMYIFKSNNYFYYKCFSTGKGGKLYDLMSDILKIPKYEMYNIIRKDFKEGKPSFKIDLDQISSSFLKNEIDYIEYRKWTRSDVKYWGKFGINLDVLNYYEVRPISKIRIKSVDESNTVRKYHDLKAPLMYGYHNDNMLHKVYMPNQSMKFFTIKAVFQGYLQCNFKTKNLLLTSSLKDIMCLKSIGITNIDIMAPPSESYVLTESELEYIKSNWDNVAVLFDSDSTGIKKMKQYKELYDFNSVYLSLSKDPSDSVKNFGKDEVLFNLVPSIHNALGI